MLADLSPQVFMVCASAYMEPASVQVLSADVDLGDAESEWQELTGTGQGLSEIADCAPSASSSG